MLIIATFQHINISKHTPTMLSPRGCFYATIGGATWHWHKETSLSGPDLELCAIDFATME